MAAVGMSKHFKSRDIPLCCVSTEVKQRSPLHSRRRDIQALHQQARDRFRRARLEVHPAKPDPGRRLLSPLTDSQKSLCELTFE